MWSWILKDGLKHVWLRTQYIADWLLQTLIVIPVVVLCVTFLLITNMLRIWDTRPDPEVTEMRFWREGFAILPFRINRRWVWLRPFWISVDTQLTGKTRLIPGGRVHPQQQAYHEYQHHVQLKFYNERDRMHRKLKNG